MLSFLHRTQLDISDRLSSPSQTAMYSKHNKHNRHQYSHETRNRYLSNEAASDLRLKDRKATGIS